MRAAHTAPPAAFETEVPSTVASSSAATAPPSPASESTWRMVLPPRTVAVVGENTAPPDCVALAWEMDVLATSTGDPATAPPDVAATQPAMVLPATVALPEAKTQPPDAAAELADVNFVSETETLRAARQPPSSSAVEFEQEPPEMVSVPFDRAAPPRPAEADVWENVESVMVRRLAP